MAAAGRSAGLPRRIGGLLREIVRLQLGESRLGDCGVLVWRDGKAPTLSGHAHVELAQRPNPGRMVQQGRLSHADFEGLLETRQGPNFHGQRQANLVNLDGGEGFVRYLCLYRYHAWQNS